MRRAEAGVAFRYTSAAGHSENGTVASAVRSTLMILGAGATLQRLCQLVAMACAARALGLERTGHYALGIALGAVLAILAGAGIRNHVARQIARQPASAGAWVRAAVRARLLLGGALTAVAVAVAVLTSDAAWFWSLAAALALPAAFDLKGLLDAVARTRSEVALESVAALLHLALVLVWARAGGDDLAALAGIHLLSRCVYATGALHALSRLPAGERVPLWSLIRCSGRVSLAQTVNECATAADVWLVGLVAGPGAAGLYAVAQRIAGAAALPSAQVARLLLPHFNRAAGSGDPPRTAATALRATAWTTLPLLGGGLMVAEPLCALFGPGFAAAGPALRLWLLAVTAQHLGWQCSHALFALDHDRAYARTLLLPAVLHLGMVAPLAGAAGAAGAAASVVLAQVVYFAITLRLLRARFGRWPIAGWTAPLLATLVTCCGAAAAGFAGGTWLPPLPALLGGAAAFGLALWGLELRGRWRDVGRGLSRASGFGG